MHWYSELYALYLVYTVNSAINALYRVSFMHWYSELYALDLMQLTH